MSNEPEGGRRRRRSEAEEASPADGALAEEVIAPAGYTGRYLVLFAGGAEQAGIAALRETTGVRAASAADFEVSAVPAEALADTEAMVFPALGVAVVNAPPAQMARLGVRATGETGIIAIEPERRVFVTEGGLSGSAVLPGIYGAPASAAAGGAGAVESLQAFQAGVNAAVAQVLGTTGLSPGTASMVAAAPAAVETDFTWGLQETNVAVSRFSGQGVGVAILDTGLDLGHPDFTGRNITSQSFIAGQQVQDGHGHGTHCTGTACGPQRPGQLPRYGIAYDANIFIGKVLSDQGSGVDGGILAGINWAIANKCAIVSMSLGAPTIPGQTFSQVFETVAQRALAQGTLIIAAAGNSSARPGSIAPVGHPANCPSILSVGALDAQLQVASFSCGGVNPQGGQVDIAGPGVAVRSSWPRPTLYRTISGTSMATPHVAGIAALHMEAQQGTMAGGTLGWVLLQSSRRLTLPARDIGVGLVQAP
jgi:subtilisin